MIRMPDALAEAGLSARMLLQVHDELIFEVPDQEADATIKVASEVMVAAPLPAVSFSVPIQVDARAADNWDEAHYGCIGCKRSARRPKRSSTPRAANDPKSRRAERLNNKYGGNTSC